MVIWVWVWGESSSGSGGESGDMCGGISFTFSLFAY